jgi:hypothetical protein
MGMMLMMISPCGQRGLCVSVKKLESDPFWVNSGLVDVAAHLLQASNHNSAPRPVASRTVPIAAPGTPSWQVRVMPVGLNPSSHVHVTPKNRIFPLMHGTMTLMTPM